MVPTCFRSVSAHADNQCRKAFLCRKVKATDSVKKKMDGIMELRMRLAIHQSGQRVVVSFKV